MNKENDALAQKEALEEEEDIQSMKDEYVRDTRLHLVAACVVMPCPLDSDYAVYTHGPTHGILKYKPVYLSALDLMIIKKEMAKYQWECLFDHIIRKRIVIADDWTNSYGKIKILFHQFIMKDSDNNKLIFMGVCDGQFIPLFKADGTPEEFGLATLAYIRWKKNMLIAARVLKGVRCRNSNVAECLVCSVLMKIVLRGMMWMTCPYQQIVVQFVVR
uniref:Uncharacterized protein n=1 Tax=Oryza punctata TaxID=4537 RepID=A0A0E0KJL4_ORYPU